MPRAPRAPNASEPKEPPLFRTDEQLAPLIMPARHAIHWQHTVEFLEQKHHFPKVDILLGGRYWPAVKEFFDRYEGIAPNTTVSKPLYMTEADIARMVLGPARDREWKGLAAILERRGLPRKSYLLYGRYWPAVRAFFDRGGQEISRFTENVEGWAPRRKQKKRWTFTNEA